MEVKLHCGRIKTGGRDVVGHRVAVGAGKGRPSADEVGRDVAGAIGELGVGLIALAAGGDEVGVCQVLGKLTLSSVTLSG